MPRAEFAFKLHLSEPEREKRLEQMKQEFALGYFEHETLAAKLANLPLQMYLGGKKLPMGGIASVATWPEHRRKRMMGMLMIQSLQAMREQGLVVSILNPFSFPFYRKFGWGYFAEIKRYRYRVGKMPAIPLMKGHIERKTKDDFAQIQHVYEAFAAQYNGMLSRELAWWANTVMLKKVGQFAVDYDEQ